VGGLDRAAPEEALMRAPRLFASIALAGAVPLAALGSQAGAEGATGLRESLRLAEVPELWVLVLVLLPLLALVSWLGYRGEPVPQPARLGLGLLRFVALATLLGVLCRPVLVQRREEVRKAEVVVLVDDSASMRRKDAYGGDERARKALVALAQRALEDTSRSELSQAALERDLLPMLASRGYVARVFAFAGDLVPLGTPLALSGRGAATHLGDALSSALAAHRGHHVTDVLVVSDGRQNGGGSASEAARAAGAAGVPVHTLVVGDTRPERNALVQLVEAPSSALEGDEIAITVRVSGRGVQGSPRVQVQLEELEGEGEREVPRVVAEEEATLGEAGERVTLVARPGSGSQRDRRFRVRLPPLEGETLLDDNKVDVSVHVTPAKVRVLYVEGYPRWEYRQLALDLLKRSDENIEFQAFLLSATPDFLQESTRGLPALREVPTSRRELLEGYDVILLGDVNPWSISPDPARAEEFMRSLVEFVEKGGGLFFVAGEFDNPRAYLSTPLEPLLPVTVDPSEMLSAAPQSGSRAFRPRLEDPHNPHEIVRLVSDVETNRRWWEEPEGLYGMYWYLPLTRAKPGSQVLLRHPEAANAHGAYPLLVAGYYPSGRTLFAAFDETWRWRFHGPRYHERYWRNAIRWLALGRLKSGDRRYRLELARGTYNLGERVSIEARVLDEDFRPSESTVQPVHWSGPDGRPAGLDLTSVPGRAGVFRGSLEADRAGLFRVWIEVAGARIASEEFEVVLPSLENQDPSPDPALLREVSLLSRGRALELAHAAELTPEFPGGEERREPISSRLDDIWDSWATLLFVLAVLSAEWILRKRLELV
jgi:uncharacterized membrane protein